MTTTPIIDLGSRSRRRPRRVIFTCLAAASLGLCLATAILWWDSETWTRTGFVGNWGWTSADGEIGLQHFGSGPCNGHPETLSIPIDIRHWFSYATRESEWTRYREYMKDFRIGDRLLCIVFAIVPAVWLITALRRRLRRRT